MANNVEIKFKIDGIEYSTQQLKDLSKAEQDAAKSALDMGQSTLEAGDDATEAGQKFQKLQTQIRETRIALQKAAEAGDDVEFNKLKGNLDELEESLEKTQFKSQQFDDQLASLPGPAGAAGNAIKSVDGLFKMLAANPILAIIVAIVGAFMLLKKSMESTAAGQAVLNRISEAFGKILGPIMLLIQKVAMPIFEGLAKVIEYVAEGFQKFASILGYSSKEIAEASRGVDKVREETEKKEEARQKKADERAKKEKERLEKQKEQQKKAAEDAKKRREEAQKAEEQRVENQKQINLKLEQLRVENLQDEALKIAEQVRLTKEAAVEEFKAKGASKAEIAKLEAMYDDMSLQKVKEYNDKKAEEQKKADEEAKKQAEEAQKEKDAKAEEERQKEIERLAKLDEMDFQREQAKLTSEAEKAIAQINRDEAMALKELDLLKATEEEKTETLEYYAALREKVRQQEVDNALKAAAQILGNIAELAGEGTIAAKAAGIAQATINTYLAASQALADPTIPTFLKPFLVATQIALGFKQVGEIASVEAPKFAMGGMVGGLPHSMGGTLIEAEAGEFVINKAAMQVPGVAQMAQSLNSTAAPGFNQGATQGPVSFGQQPIKAYVVATEMSNAQEANQNIERLARL